MATTPDQLTKIAVQIDEILDRVAQHEKENVPLLHKVYPTYRESAQNLLHYAAFRSFDAREMQKGLKRLGFTRLANAEGNILGSLINLKKVVNSLQGTPLELEGEGVLSIGEGKQLLKKHTAQLLGDNKKGRRVHIMVTQPTESAYDYEKVLAMVQNGMDCARVNCAHDGPEVWEAIIKNVRKAAKECGTEVKIAMDLAGPKVRTGAIQSGPKVKKFKPKRDEFGKVTAAAKIELVPKSKEFLTESQIPVDAHWLKKLVVGDRLRTKDIRGKDRKLKIVHTQEDKVALNCNKTLYVEMGTVLEHPDIGVAKVGELPRIQKGILLRVGDTLIVSGNEAEGVLPKFDSNKKLMVPARIPCIPSHIVSKAKMGAPILFDDGKIEGVIKSIADDFFEVKITKAKEGGSLLKAEKGINLPTLDLGMDGLTAKDKQDLKFVAKHADIVNCSYVNTEEDVIGLLNELEALGVKDSLGIILKIETNTAYKNLIGILLAAMQTKLLGVMIARGDLALEVGWKKMGMVQEGILSFSSAAHIPVVWATQVLEGLAKKGVPSRSEITDITSSIQAECVMLNKGPHINEAIQLLDDILSNMETSHEKKEVMLPKMEWL
ncbi:pyruvate kinase [Flagellimonas iocasae]|uniref:pyruvate kinase n=1 Tax=Flagellimonas iocasae TaxID=2055905 RepID=A0ABW4XY02_9FLAO